MYSVGANVMASAGDSATETAQAKTTALAGEAVARAEHDLSSAEPALNIEAGQLVVDNAERDFATAEAPDATNVDMLPIVTIAWMWGDTTLGYRLSNCIPLHWSSRKDPLGTIIELQEIQVVERPVHIRIYRNGRRVNSERFGTKAAAITALKDTYTAALEKRSNGSTMVGPSPFLLTAKVYRMFEACSQWAASGVMHGIGKCQCFTHTINDNLKALEVVAPEARDGYAILHFHGGGHAVGSMWFYTDFFRRLSKVTEAHVISIDYRKAPEHPFPAGVDDALSAWHWMLRRGYSANSVAILGDSAGGNLSFSLCVHLAQLKEAQPAACIGFAPWLLLCPDMVDESKLKFDAHADQPDFKRARAKCGSIVTRAVTTLQDSAVWYWGAKFFMGQYFQNHDPRDPRISPLLASDEILKRFPPIAIHVDKFEPLFVEAAEMDTRCKAAGVQSDLVVYEGTMHGMQIVNSGCKEQAEESLRHLHDFLEPLWHCSPHIEQIGDRISPKNSNLTRESFCSANLRCFQTCFARAQR